MRGRLRAQDARAVAQRYRAFLEQEQRRIEEAESERLRVHLETARLLARADCLERRAEEEATQVTIMVLRSLRVQLGAVESHFEARKSIQRCCT